MFFCVKQIKNTFFFNKTEKNILPVLFTTPCWLTSVTSRWLPRVMTQWRSTPSVSTICDLRWCTDFTSASTTSRLTAWTTWTILRPNRRTGYWNLVLTTTGWTWAVLTDTPVRRSCSQGLSGKKKSFTEPPWSPLGVV